VWNSKSVARLASRLILFFGRRLITTARHGMSFRPLQGPTLQDGIPDSGEFR